MSIPKHYPGPVADALAAFVADCDELAPEPHAVVVYGSLARNEYRPDDSDVNIAIVLGNPTANVLAALRGPLHAVSEAVRVQPLVIGRNELMRLADVFPILIDEIKHHHDVILGDSDPFDEITVARADLRLEVEHELRNHLLRLRRYYLFAGNDAGQLGRAVMSSVTSLAYELGALLHVIGSGPSERSRQAVFDAAGQAFGLDREVLTRIRTYRPSAGDDAKTLENLFFALLGLVEAAVDAVDKLDKLDA